MKHGFVRVRAAAPEIKVGDTEYNAKCIIAEIERAAKDEVEILVFPELAISGYTCGDLFLQQPLLDGCLAALAKIKAATQDKKMLVFVGLPYVLDGKTYDCAAAVSGGRVLCFIPKVYFPDYGEFYESRYFSPVPVEERLTLYDGEPIPFSEKLILCDKTHPEIKVGCEICEDLWTGNPPSVTAATAGASIICNLSASSEVVGKRNYRKMLVSSQSGRNICAYVYADAGMGESNTDLAFSGNHLIYENGKLLEEAEPFSGECATAEVDVSFLLHERRRISTYRSTFLHNRFSIACDFVGNSDIKTRKFSRTPFVPADKEREDRAETILRIQAEALKKRLVHAGCESAVIGVSGGLDSALALLVTARAFDLMQKPHDKIIAVSMPGFGTSEKTKNNSLALIEALGATLLTIPISSAVEAHFKEIGHDIKRQDTTYENAQARYRTFTLMDLANERNGLVVGTGDMSEIALGFCTFNGDHISMYNVNSSVPKTLVKHLVSREKSRLGGDAEKVLDAVLATEISPELLPPDKSGNITQKTEEIVGSYELNDFFLYHFLRRGGSPEKVCALAKRAFEGVYKESYIKERLAFFYKRFFSQQFKRNCAPDGVKVGSVSLSPRGDFRMPSDAEATLWLNRIDKS